MRDDFLIRCSAIGGLMTSPTAAAIKAGEVLSVGAKTAVRKLVAQEILGIDFEISSKQMEKGIEVEPEAIAMLNRVMGLSLAKNIERRDDGYISGECDLWDAPKRAGYDTKASWSAATFPIVMLDAVDSGYEWQARGYMKLWDAQRWTVAYCLVNTPERLIGYEPGSMHFFDHIPEHLRVTTWTIERDLAKEAEMIEKVKAARIYAREVIAEFARLHPDAAVARIVSGNPPFTPPKQRAALPDLPLTD
jgi:hypothetical protein